MWEAIEPRLKDLARRAGVRDAPPAAVAAVLAIALVAVGWALWRWWPSSAGASAVVPESVATETSSEVVATESDSQDGPAVAVTAPVGETDAAQESTLAVHVAGQVHRPGVYRLPAGSRVVDAVDSAGGLLGSAAASSLNLARQLTDGEQVYVPSVDEVEAGTVPAAAGATDGGSLAPGAAGSAAGSSASGATTLVDINTAGESELLTLPGVGPATAKKIIADREANGPFSSPEDIGRVSGIGPKKLEELKGLVCVQ